MSQPAKNEQDGSNASGASSVPGNVPGNVASNVLSSVRTGAQSRCTGLGIALMLLSGVLWFSLFAIPFLPITTSNKALLAGAIFITVQIAWWGGAALAGPQVVRKVKGWMSRRK